MLPTLACSVYSVSVASAPDQSTGSRAGTASRGFGDKLSKAGSNRHKFTDTWIGLKWIELDWIGWTGTWSNVANRLILMCSPMLRTLSPTRVMTVAIGSIMFSSLTFSSLDVLNTSCVSLLRWPVGTQYRSCPSMIPHTWALEGLRLLILGPFWHLLTQLLSWTSHGIEFLSRILFWPFHIL